MTPEAAYILGILEGTLGSIQKEIDHVRRLIAPLYEEMEEWDP